MDQEKNAPYLTRFSDNYTTIPLPLYQSPERSPRCRGDALTCKEHDRRRKTFVAFHYHGEYPKRYFEQKKIEIMKQHCIKIMW